MEGREVRGEGKNYLWSLFVPWRPTHIGPPCRG